MCWQRWCDGAVDGDGDGGRKIRGVAGLRDERLVRCGNCETVMVAAL